MSCLEETPTTAPPRWTTGGRRSSTSRCWVRSPWWFADRRPIRAWVRTARPPTRPPTYLCSYLDVCCISQRRGRRGGASEPSINKLMSSSHVQTPQLFSTDSTFIFFNTQFTPSSLSANALADTCSTTQIITQKCKIQELRLQHGSLSSCWRW